MYQVLALDLDGTVLDNDHNIHPDVKAAIIDVKKIAHVILVTGRHHTAARPYYEELELDTPIICCNGTYIYDFHSQSVLAESSISKENARRFLEIATQNQMKVVLYVTNSMLYSRHQPIDYMETLSQWAATCSSEIKPEIRKVDSFENEIDTANYIWKFVIEGQPESIEKLSTLEFIRLNFSGERSWSNRVDFASKGNSKGARLAQYLAQNSYKPDQVIAVGDNHNDISMIKLAGLGVAMKNADQAVKDVADIVCKTDNNQDGLAHLIRENFIGNSYD